MKPKSIAYSLKTGAMKSIVLAPQNPVYLWATMPAPCAESRSLRNPVVGNSGPEPLPWAIPHTPSRYTVYSVGQTLFAFLSCFYPHIVDLSWNLSFSPPCWFRILVGCLRQTLGKVFPSGRVPARNIRRQVSHTHTRSHLAEREKKHKTCKSPTTLFNFQWHTRALCSKFTYIHF